MKRISSPLSSKPIRLGGLLCILLASFMIGTTTGCIMLEPRVEPEDRATEPEALRVRLLPMTFEQNLGQTREDVHYLARGNGYSLFLRPEGAVLRLEKPARGGSGPAKSSRTEVFRMTLLGANPDAESVGMDRTETRSHYFIGSDPSRWLRNVPGYAQVEFRDVYAGVDAVYRGTGGDLEYDFIVHPGADPANIRLGIDGADRVYVDGQGNLVSEFEEGLVVQHPPTLYQEIGGERQIVGGGYKLEGDEVRFSVGRYDPERTLIIDPIVAYSTYLGGAASDTAFEIAVDGDGNAYVTGTTLSTDFPTAEAFQSGARENGDAFIAKLTPDGSAAAFVTYVGGDSADVGRAITLDSVGNVFITGATDSTDFPLQGAIQNGSAGFFDVFITALSPSGDQLLYSTYLGGSGDDIATDIALDIQDNILITGETDSPFFPTANAFQELGLDINDAFITKLNAQGTGFVFSTYLGFSSSGRAIVADEDGNVWVAGVTSSGNFPKVDPIQSTFRGEFDGFLARFGPTGALEFSTLLGGSDIDLPSGIAIESSEAVVVVGQTFSTDFPTVNAFQSSLSGVGDAFLTVLDVPGKAWSYSTYLGGSETDSAADVVVGIHGGIYVTGSTDSTDFPTVSPTQTNADERDVFVVRLAAGSHLITYSTYVGGSGVDVAGGLAVDNNRNVYITGSTTSTDFPTLGPLQSESAGATDAFILRITPDQTTFELAGGGASFTTPGEAGATVAGYSQSIPDAGSTTPPGMAIFSFRNEGVVVSEASVPATTTLQTGRIYAQVGGSVNTGLAIANPNPESANVSFFFTDGNGATVGSGSFSIEANSQIARFLNEEPFNSGPEVDGTFTFSSSLPLAVVALRGFTNERSEFLTTTLPVTPLPATSTDTILFPHFADGGGWTTQIVLVNPTGAPISGSVEFRDTGEGEVRGQPVELMLADGGIGSDFDYTIPSRSSVRLKTANVGALKTGSVRIVPDDGSVTPAGLGIFSFKSGGITVSEAGVPADAVGTAFRSYVESSGTPGLAGSIRTGVAIANTSEAPVDVSFELTRLDGTAVGLSTSATVPDSGQVALFIDELFPTLENPFSGIVRISSSSSSVALVGLRARTNERGDFLITTTPPSNEADPPSTEDMFFPHFADAGGWTTQFILFSGSNQSAAGVLRFFDQQGRILDLPLS